MKYINGTKHKEFKIIILTNINATEHKEFRIIILT